MSVHRSRSVFRFITIDPPSEMVATYAQLYWLDPLRAKVWMYRLALAAKWAYKQKYGCQPDKQRLIAIMDEALKGVRPHVLPILLPCVIT